MLYSIIYLTSFFATLGLAFLVFLKDKSSKLHRAFFWFVISGSCWIFTLYFFYFYHSGYVLQLGRLNFVFAELMAFFGGVFGYWFPKRTFKLNPIIKIILLIWIIILVSITMFTGLIDKDEIVTADGIETEFGPLYFVFVIHFMIFISLLIILPLLKYKKLSILHKYQVKYLVIGAFLMVVFASTTNIFLPLFFNYYDAQHLGPLLTFFFILAVAYSIVAHRLMDIKLVVRRYLVYTSSLITVVVPVIIVRYISIVYYYNYATLVEFVVLILAISVFLPVKNYYYRVANKYLFSSLYNSAEVIASVSDKLRSTLNIKSIYSHIYESLNNAMHLKAFGILKYEDKTGNYYVQYNKGFHVKNRKKFASNKVLHEIFTKRNQALVVDEAVRTHYNSRTKETLDMLVNLEVSILMPLNIKDKVVGLMAIGAKESGDMYNDEDMKVLEVVSAQAAVAIENATLYDESLKFGNKLEKEVKKATAELRVMNEKLKEMDAAKSEFISIASHQLRTPLTVIKGYISMILEGNFGKLMGKEKDPLKKVYESNERLIQLVENLLNISRIESGRLQFTFDNVQLEDMAKSVLNELASHAKRKKLKLVYEPPKKPLPLILIDEEKIRQAIMNLIDNAIKYTKDNGSVTVTLKEVEGDIKPSAVKARLAEAGIEATTVNNFIEFCVEDTGMGIPESEMKNLFKKFSRAAGTALVHTEGTGLGLYVARKMIEAHAGKIWAESEGEGKGSRFLFRLPAIEALKK